MFIPIGHDQDRLRRWPIVTFAIIGICAVVYFAPSAPSTEDITDTRHDLRDAVEYYLKNPDLAPHPLIRRAVLSIAAMEDRETRREIREHLEHPPADKPLHDMRQEELNKRTNRWLDHLRRRPPWRWGLIPTEITPSAWVTHMFVHGDVLHLLFNMLFLYLTGPFIEDILGRPLFILFYGASGLAAAAAVVWHDPHAAAPLIGASGAIAGVMGAFLVRYPRAWIRFWHAMWVPPGTFYAPAWLMLPLWFLGEFINARAGDAASYGGMQVAYWAHVGGFAFGVVVALALRALNVEERFLDEAIESRREPGRDLQMYRVSRLLQKGQLEEACQLLETAVVRNPSNRDAGLAYWDLAWDLGRIVARPAVCLRLIHAELRSTDPVTGLEHWQTLQQRLPEVQPDVGLAVALAECLTKYGRSGEAVRLVDGAAERMEPSTAPDVLVALAKAAAAAGSPRADEIRARVLAHPRVPREAKAALQPALRMG